MPLEIIRQDNSKHPFMRGMLAHKLIQRGLSFDQAYQISKDARSFFQEQAEVSSDSLMQAVDELIVNRYGKELLKGAESGTVSNRQTNLCFSKKRHRAVFKRIINTIDYCFRLKTGRSLPNCF